MIINMGIQEKADKTRLLFRAAFKKAHIEEQVFLPESVQRVTNIKIDTAHLAAYNSCIHWPHGNIIPATYLHVLAFRQQLDLVLDDACPFKLLGLVHLSNRIEQFRPIHMQETLRADCQLQNLQPHPKGWCFDLVCQFWVEDELVWRGCSTNLYRCDSPGQGRPPMLHSRSPQKQESWQLDAELGRQYAQVSGDYNPIHLYPWTAKLLGFKGHIVHGMWSKARCLSALAQDLPPRFNLYTEFRRPLFLPSQVGFHCQVNDQQRDFEIRSADGRHIHLQGYLKAVAVD